MQAVFTDNGREFCGRPEHHAYESMLALRDIDRRRTQVRHRRTNGFVERVNRTLLDECFRVKNRTPPQALREALGRKKLPPAVPIAAKSVPKQVARSHADDRGVGEYYTCTFPPFVQQPKHKRVSTNCQHTRGSRGIVAANYRELRLRSIRLLDLT